MGAGPSFEEIIVKQQKNNPNVQMMVLDTYNGTPAQAESYRQITGVTVPMLRQASNGLTYAGAVLEDIVVVDQDNTVRLSVNAAGTDLLHTVNEMVESLLNSTPLVSLSLRELYFGTKLEVGNSKTIQMTVNNTGAGDLEVTGMRTEVGGMIMEPSNFVVKANDKVTVNLTLTPDQPGALTGTVTLLHNDPSVGTIVVPIRELTIEGSVSPLIALVREDLIFTDTEVGRSQTLMLTVKNEGPGVLTVSAIKSSLPEFQVLDWNFTLQTNESREVSVVFQPQAEGTVTGNLEVRSDDPNTPLLNLSLSGRGVVIPVNPRADFDGSGTVDFADFLGFVQAFGQAEPAYDLNDSGTVDFGDFLILVQSFGKSVE